VPVIGMHKTFEATGLCFGALGLEDTVVGHAVMDMKSVIHQ